MGATPDKAKDVAEGIMEVEKQIANFTEPPDQRRDVKKLYHNMTLEQLSNLAPFVSAADDSKQIVHELGVFLSL